MAVQQVQRDQIPSGTPLFSEAEDSVLILDGNKRFNQLMNYPFFDP